ncbi:bacteriocin [Thomasclavelia cocleata]|jgi:predicted bacteriocin transport accessory protein|uniref:bacteriocin n=1 Tax=Thomasclavelia cocleata TaxID=69824 RepID=UPI0024304A9F|nr:bacteriocin [Thomasclavelia cocleata]MCI9629422.1 bacteriocin [Thomasclavelia cocleata]
MKKLLCLILCLFMISGCQQASTNHIKKDSSLSGIHEITYEQLQKKLKSDELFALYIGRPDCGDCREFEPILTSYLEENEGIYIYYLNIKTFRDASKKEDATQEEKDFYENIRDKLDFSWTPVLKLINKGETISEYTYLSEEYYEIKDSKKKEQAKEKYIKDFKTWMSNIYE